MRRDGLRWVRLGGLLVTGCSVIHAPDDPVPPSGGGGGPAPEVLATPTEGLLTTEEGAEATFTLVLGTAPLAEVTVELSSSDLTEGEVEPASLTFTPADWSEAVTVTVVGVADGVDDGDQEFRADLGPTRSDDPAYDDLDPDDVHVTNVNVDQAGLVLGPDGGLTTTEDGVEDVFSVSLATRPTATVTLALSSSDETEGTVSPPSVIFTLTSWDEPQLVTVTGVTDTEQDGDVAYSIAVDPTGSSAAEYATLEAVAVSVTNVDTTP